MLSGTFTETYLLNIPSLQLNLSLVDWFIIMNKVMRLNVICLWSNINLANISDFIYAPKIIKNGVNLWRLPYWTKHLSRRFFYYNPKSGGKIPDYLTREPGYRSPEGQVKSFFFFWRSIFQISSCWSTILLCFLLFYVQNAIITSTAVVTRGQGRLQDSFSASATMLPDQYVGGWEDSWFSWL